jgi:hypothetical protein
MTSDHGPDPGPSEPGATGVGDDDVHRFGPPPADIPADDARRERAQVVASVGGGVPVAFDSDHSTRRIDEGGEQADAAEEIGDDAVGTDGIADETRKGFGTIDAALEERVCTHTKADAIDEFVNGGVRPSPYVGRDLDRRVLRVCPYASFAGTDARSYGDLARVVKAAVAEHVVHKWVGNQAALHRNRVVRVMTPERGPPVNDERAYRRAVAGGRELDRVTQWRVLDVGDPAERIGDDVPLVCALRVNGDVLPSTAAATVSRVHARWLDPFRCGLQQFDHLRPQMIRAIRTTLPSSARASASPPATIRVVTSSTRSQ